MNKSYTIDEIKNIATDVAKKYGIEKIALFGSYARGDQKNSSDIDFIIKRGILRVIFSFVVLLAH